MTEEQFVSFEVAKLLKEIGFNIPINTSYSEDGKSEYNMLPDNFNKFQDKFSRPTQALAARWLREVHRIVVDATFIPQLFDGVNWQYFIGNMDDMVWEGDFEPSERKYATYEAAFEDGLREAIKLIKK